VSARAPVSAASGSALSAARADAAHVYRLRVVEPDRVQLDRQPLALGEPRLVSRAREGDRSAFDALVRIHADRLYAVVLRLCASPHEAEEVTQEAFLRAWRAIECFDGRARFFTWLYRIGVNEAKRRAGRRQPEPRPVALEEATGEPPDLSDAPHCRAERSELRAALESAVRGLPLDFRAALILRDIEGLSTSEAAKTLGLSEAALKSRLHRARASVRDALGDRLGEGSRG
jgi:RNA polymerase sigma-70 factor (ECF subfamily)